MTIKLRLARLEAARQGEGEPLLVVTGVPRGGADDGTGPAVARVGGRWHARGAAETAAAFAARLGCPAEGRPA